MDIELQRLSTHALSSPLASVKSRKTMIGVAKSKQNDPQKIKTLRLHLKQQGIDSRIEIPSLLRVLDSYKRSKFYSEFFVFIIFLIVLLVVLLYARPMEYSYWTSAAVTQQQYDNFVNIQTPAQFFSFLSQDIIPFFYQEQWYNGDPFVYNLNPSKTRITAGNYTEQDKGTLAGTTRLVGALRIRTMRMKPKRCNAVKDWTCWGWYNQQNQATEFIGRSTGISYEYKSGISFAPSVTAVPYGHSGFVVDIPQNATLQYAQDVVANLTADRWIDDATRFVSIEFNVYNPVLDLISINRYWIEIFPTGFFINNLFSIGTPYSWYPTSYSANVTGIRIFFELLFLSFVIFYAVVEYNEMYTQKINYFRQFFNWLELLSLALYFALIISWIRFAFDPQRLSFDVTNRTSYLDLLDAGYILQNLDGVAGTAIMLCFVKIFKYLKLNTRLSTVWKVLANTLGDLSAYMIIMFVFIIGFSFMGHLVYGHLLYAYHSPYISISSNLRMLLGDFTDQSYETLRQADYVFTPFFYPLYLTIVFFVLMQVFVAVLAEGYKDIKELTARERKSRNPSLTYHANYDLISVIWQYYDRMKRRDIKVGTLEKESLTYQSHQRVVLGDAKMIGTVGNNTKGGIGVLPLAIADIFHFLEINDRIVIQGKRHPSAIMTTYAAGVNGMSRNNSNNNDAGSGTGSGSGSGVGDVIGDVVGDGDGGSSAGSGVDVAAAAAATASTSSAGAARSRLSTNSTIPLADRPITRSTMIFGGQVRIEKDDDALIHVVVVEKDVTDQVLYGEFTNGGVVHRDDTVVLELYRDIVDKGVTTTNKGWISDDEVFDCLDIVRVELKRRVTNNIRYLESVEDIASVLKPFEALILPKNIPKFFDHAEFISNLCEELMHRFGEQYYKEDIVTSSSVPAAAAVINSNWDVVPSNSNNINNIISTKTAVAEDLSALRNEISKSQQNTQVKFDTLNSKVAALDSKLDSILKAISSIQAQQL